MANIRNINSKQATDARTFSRYPTRIIATLDKEIGRVTIISFSAGGCAIRTTTRLTPGQEYSLTIPNYGSVKTAVVWGMDDFHIDTIYRYGLAFKEPMPQDKFSLLLALIQQNAA